MSKNQKPTGVAWGEASDELKDKVKLVLQMKQNNRYSVSRIYFAHNKVFGLNEAPETCSTCLTSRATNLLKWWAANAPTDQPADPTQPIIGEDGEVVGKPAIPATPAKVTGVKQTPKKGGLKPEDRSDLTAARNEALKDKQSTDPNAPNYVAPEAETLEERVSGKLLELGVDQDSSDEDQLEALEVLAAQEGNPADEAELYGQLIHALTERIAADNVVAFTPEVEGAQYGIATKGGQPLPAGNYDHEGQQYAVSGDQGHYTVITGEPAGDAAKPTAHVIEVDALKLVYTPSAEDASKGTVAWEDGSKVKAGTYTSLAGVNIAVQVGGKASIK